MHLITHKHQFIIDTHRIWGKEGEKWICKTILSDTHERTIRSGDNYKVHKISFSKKTT